MKELKLTDREWKSFQIEQIFTIEKVFGKPITTYSEGNCISVDPISGKSFYHSYNFIGRGFSGASINLLRHIKLNKYNAIFLCCMIENTAMTKASYGNLFNSNRLKKGLIYLPINSEASPDWQFMEDYIKQKESHQIKQLIDYYTQQATDILIQSSAISDRKWKAFSFDKIFKQIQRGKRLTKSNQIDGNTPYISSSAAQNGVDNFISNHSNIRKFENCLTLANSGSVGSTFYHHYQFIASDHVTALTLEKPNKYIYLFLSSIIKRLEEKYSFNREINDKRINREKILLPIDDNENPDWQFMEDFIKQLEKDKIQTTLQYYNNMINKENSSRGGSRLL